MLNRAVAVDFEGFEIVKGSPGLPEPVGCSIDYMDKSKEPRYWAWGHPEGNNCTREEFQAELESIWDRPWITHNGCAFDVEVARHHFGLAPRDPLLTDDTMLLAYLHDPHAQEIGLKPLCQNWLGMAPDERDAVHDWIMENVPQCPSRRDAGKYIAFAPGDLVGAYALGDTSRSVALLQYLEPLTESMREAYDRERYLAPILAEMRQIGVRVDLEALRRDCAVAKDKLVRLEQAVRDYLCAPELNVGSTDQLCGALKARGYSGFLLTPSGKDSVSGESLDAVLAGVPELRAMLTSRQIYAKTVGYMDSWIKFAEPDGRLHPQFNQTRNQEGYGTRTGRLSCVDPNLQQTQKEQKELDWEGDAYPAMRSYILPDEGHVLTVADFKNQEPRIAAHFEDGALLEQYQNDPLLDPYVWICGLVSRPVGEFRGKAKVIFLALLYAMGAELLADKLGCSFVEATMLRNLIKASLPDIVQLDRDCKRRFKQGLPIRTLGGRLYFCEPARNGRTFDYKALNVLVQGSAADESKEAMIYTYQQIQARPHLKNSGCRITIQVHDEWHVSHPEEYSEEIAQIMREAAQALPCDVPMILDLGVGHNWGEVK